MATAKNKLMEIHRKLMEDASNDDIEEIAYLMDTEPDKLESKFSVSSIGLIRDCLMQLRRFDLLRLYFNNYSSLNNHDQYQYEYIKPLRRLLYDLYGEMSNDNDIIQLFWDIDVTMVNDQHILRSLSEVEHRFSKNEYSSFLEDLEKALAKKSIFSNLRNKIGQCREHSEIEIDHLSRESDLECGTITSKLPPSGDSTTKEEKPRCYLTYRNKVYGYCLIINNVTFMNEAKYSKRNGSDKDASDLQKLFEDLDYEVAVLNNVTKKDMETFLTVLRIKDFSEISILVVFILSHGEKDVFILSDGEKIDFENSFQQYFMPKYIPSLAEKPKLFFIQACQGNDSFDTFPTNGIERNQVDECLVTDSGVSCLPSEVDFYIAVSTVPNYSSQRNTCSGGWFIQSLVEIVKKHAKTCDLHHVMTMVNDHLTTRKGRKGQTQCSNVRRMTLRKLCYLGRKI